MLRHVRTVLRKGIRSRVPMPTDSGDLPATLRFVQEQGWPYLQVGRRDFLLYTPKPLPESVLERLNRTSQACWTVCHQSALWEAMCAHSEDGYTNHNSQVEALLEQAFALRVSDIFLTLNGEVSTLRFRQQRTLQAPIQMNGEKGAALLKSLLVLAHLNIDDTLREQEGHFRYTLRGKLVFCRLSYIASAVSQSLVLRLLSEDLFPFEITALHLPQPLQKELLSRSWDSGMILISGATGSGKTTTLYALGKLLHQQSKKIIAIEDPIEAEADLWLQTEVNPHGGYTFDVALKAVLRQDPNVLLLGEIRDKETAQAAFYASLSGYLVVTTLHAQSLEHVPIRCRELGIDMATFKDNIRLQIHQQWDSEAALSPTFTWRLQ